MGRDLPKYTDEPNIKKGNKNFLNHHNPYRGVWGVGGGWCTFSLGFKIFRPNIGEFAKFHYINLSPKKHHMKKFRFSEKVVMAGANTPFLLLALVLLDTFLLILFQK